MVYDVSFVASGPCVRACVHACVSECASEKLFVTGITVIEYENETLVGFLYAEKRKKKNEK